MSGTHSRAPAVERVPLDAYITTGTSPTRHRRYDTVHVLGPGAVGGALLRRLADDRRRVIAVTDSTGTVHDARGVDIASVLAWKRAGRALRDHPGPHAPAGAAAIEHVDADIIADCTSTDLDRAGWTAVLSAALARGACVASAAKAALCDAGAEWLTGEHGARVGINAVLGGTGRQLIGELDELRRRTRGIAIVGNASTTAILEAIERGGSLEEGIGEAQRRGYLEPDPELDLRGTDAAIKLAIVAGIVTARRIDPRAIAVEDIRSVDPFVVRARARGHATTRLVARLTDEGVLRVAYEEVARESLLAAPCGRVVYEYRLGRGERRFHFGTGLGADATADALRSDIGHLGAHAAVHAQRRAGAR
ncbi:MAG TPA: hypothetical protein VFZ24_02835 [Longimicrobiales bacterium]